MYITTWMKIGAALFTFQIQYLFAFVLFLHMLFSVASGSSIMFKVFPNCVVLNQKQLVFTGDLKILSGFLCLGQLII